MSEATLAAIMRGLRVMSEVLGFEVRLGRPVRSADRTGAPAAVSAVEGSGKGRGTAGADDPVQGEESERVDPGLRRPGSCLADHRTAADEQALQPGVTEHPDAGRRHDGVQVAPVGAERDAGGEVVERRVAGLGWRRTEVRPGATADVVGVTEVHAG